MENTGKKYGTTGQPVPGLLEWFRVGEYERVEKTLATLNRIGFRLLRTGFSWADYHTSEGRQWYDWLLPRLADEIEVLPCFLYTPPSLGIEPKTSSPPRNPKSYADFLDLVIGRYGRYFEYVELWNEPNNLSEYDFTLDRDWHFFCEMAGAAAYWMKRLGKRTVLGGMAPVDPNWLHMLFRRDVMTYIDVVGIHHFPGVFESRWEGWERVLAKVGEVITNNGGNQRIWITETGFATTKYDQGVQLARYLEAAAAPVDRMYWYGLSDLHEDHPTVDGFHLDEREYAFGMHTSCGVPKLLCRYLQQPRLFQGLEEVIGAWTAEGGEAEAGQSVLVIGGGGRTGAQLVRALLEEGRRVTVADNLSSEEAAGNLLGLTRRYGGMLKVAAVDFRNKYRMKQLVRNASFVYDLAWCSGGGPGPEEFGANLQGTLQLLEALAGAAACPPMVGLTVLNPGAPAGLKQVLTGAANEVVQAFATARNLDVTVLHVRDFGGSEKPGFSAREITEALLRLAERPEVRRGTVYMTRGENGQSRIRFTRKAGKPVTQIKEGVLLSEL